MPDPDDRAPRAPWRAIAVGVLVCLAGWIVYRGSLAYFFAQDDFLGLARARGLAPGLTGLWRRLSGQTYFELMAGIAGLDPLPYRLASLAAHLATALLLVALLRRRASWPAAWVGATFFVVHPALFTALYSVSGIGEILALGFGLGALLVASRDDPARWLALPLFAVSLLCKESTLLLPVAAALRLARPPGAPAPGRPHRGPDLMPIGLGALAIAYAVYFAFFIHPTQFMGPHAALRPAAAPYATAFDDTMLWNLLTYLGWTVNFLLPTVRSFTDAIERMLTPASAAAIVLWAAGLAWRRLRERGWVAGGVLYLCFLLPVLPLANHTYHYYLYAPLAGAAWCVAALADAARGTGAARRRPRHGARADAGRPEASMAPVWAVAALAVVALTVNAALLVRKIETHPFTHPALRADATVDRALIARRVRDGLDQAALPDGVQLLFWSPPSIALERAAGRDTTVESYWERNVRQALLDGLAVRTLFPRVRDVAFVRAYRPTGPGTRWALYTVDGRLRVATSAEVDSLLRLAESRR